MLIVEDEPGTLLVLRISLEAAGFETSLAADGATALQRIEVERPDVVLLDLMLPVVDGWEVLAGVRSRSDRPAIIVMSAKGAARDKARAEEMGAVAYVTKPFGIEDVVDAISDVLKGGSPAEAGIGLDVRPALGIEGIESA